MKACQEQYPDLKVQYCTSVAHAAEQADALLLVTEWAEFAALNLAELAARMKTPILVDGRNLFNPEAAWAAGFDYAGIGRANRKPQAHASA